MVPTIKRSSDYRGWGKSHNACPALFLREMGHNHVFWGEAVNVQEAVVLTPHSPSGGLGGLEALLKAQTVTAGHPPVERWNPPYCGDIGMRIAGDGTWFYQGSPIGRKPLVKLFASVLRKDEDGRTYLVTPVEKVDVAVDDAHFLAVELSAEGEGGDQVLAVRTNVDDIVVIDASHPLRFGVDTRSGGLKPYLLVRGRLEALFIRARYYDLVELAAVDSDRLGVWSSGVFFPMAAAAGLEGLAQR